MPLRRVPDETLVASYGVFFHSKYPKESEVAIPGYYAALLEDWNTTAEMTAAGTHAGVHRYTCHGDELCVITVNMCHSADDKASSCKNATVNLVPDTTGSGVSVVTGSVHFAGSLSGTVHSLLVHRFLGLTSVQLTSCLFSPTHDSGRGVQGGLHIYFYATIEVTSGTAAYSGSGSWEAGKVSPGVTSVPYTQSGSLGAYLSLQPNITGSDVQARL
jgi:hypothetical protein